MEYCRLIKNPKYCPLYRDSYAKELVRLAQVMLGLAEVTNTIYFYTQKRSTCRLMARRHLNPDSSELQTRKSGFVLHTPHSSRRPIKLPGQLRNLHYRPPHRQTTLQQRHLHAQCKVHDNRNQRFLSKHTHGP